MEKEYKEDLSKEEKGEENHYEPWNEVTIADESSQSTQNEEAEGQNSRA